MDDSHHDFGWQGIRLRVPSEWELGRGDGDMSSGYARLADARMVRAEVEWRAAPVRGAAGELGDFPQAAFVTVDVQRFVFRRRLYGEEDPGPVRA